MWEGVCVSPTSTDLCIVRSGSSGRDGRDGQYVYVGIKNNGFVWKQPKQNIYNGYYLFLSSTGYWINGGDPTRSSISWRDRCIAQSSLNLLFNIINTYLII